MLERGVSLCTLVYGAARRGLGLYLGVIKQHPPKGPRRSLPGLIA